MRWPFSPKPSFAVPNQVARMPMGLQRSQAYPAAPWITQAAAQSYMAGEEPPVAYMPQKMLFTKWKTPPAGYSTAPGMSAVNVVELGQMFEQQRRAMRREAVTGMTLRDIAQPMNNLPAPDLYMNPHPIQRDMLQRPDVQSGQMLNQLAYNIAQDPTQAGMHMLPRYGPPRVNDANRVRAYR